MSGSAAYPCTARSGVLSHAAHGAGAAFPVGLRETLCPVRVEDALSDGQAAVGSVDSIAVLVLAGGWGD